LYTWNLDLREKLLIHQDGLGRNYNKGKIYG
jgi:hypothetical protein